MGFTVFRNLKGLECDSQSIARGPRVSRLRCLNEHSYSNLATLSNHNISMP